MNILKFVTKDDSDKKTGVILRKLDQMVNDYSYLVPDGWRFILKMHDASEEEPYYHIDIQSNKGGGDYAEAKMFTLEMFGKAATGGETIEQLREMIDTVGLGDSEVYSEMLDVENVDQLSDECWVLLRDVYNIAPCYGGIRIPYSDLIVEGNNILKENGEIRLAFSGASQEQDLFFALIIFRALKDSFIELYPNIRGWFDLGELKKVPPARMWLDIMGITET